MGRNASDVFFASVVLVSLTLTACSGGSGGGSGGGTSDTTPPTVVAVDPPDGALGVLTDKPIVATFSEQLDSSTVFGNFVIKDDGGAPVSGGSVTASGKNAFFTPTAATLHPATLYHATLSTGITDVAGNPLVADFTWSFRTVVDQWNDTVINSATPTPRTGHTAVWTGDEMIVWGGDTTAGVTPTGGRYDPIGDAWTATSTSNAPSARTDHTAVWTGSKMIVWGGTTTDGNPTNTGAIYDPGTTPGTDTWTAARTTFMDGSSLPALTGQTAIWTGTKMIVWGGLATGNTPTNTGAIYDPGTSPGTDTWTAIPNTFVGGNALPARVGHTAIWTGTDMIVWGGTINNTPVSTGARYNLAANRWTLIANAPFARSDHTAVWTGSEMIVWGGTTSSNQGARYNPTTATWTLMTTTNAPTGRVGNTAIWTGTEMIVWGGTASPSSNQGAAYRPSTNTWRAISITSNTPTARTDHTAVWTGNGTAEGEMIVWGGDSGTLENSGGRYAP